MGQVSVYLFDHIPGAWERWTLAVFAVSERDARNYVRIYNGGGRLAGQVDGGDVNADCGATTSAAAAIIRERNERNTR